MKLLGQVMIQEGHVFPNISVYLAESHDEMIDSFPEGEVIVPGQRCHGFFSHLDGLAVHTGRMVFLEGEIDQKLICHECSHAAVAVATEVHPPKAKWGKVVVHPEWDEAVADLTASFIAQVTEMLLQEMEPLDLPWEQGKDHRDSDPPEGGAPSPAASPRA